MGSCCACQNKLTAEGLLYRKVRSSERTKILSLRDMNLDCIPDQVKSLEVFTLDLTNNKIQELRNLNSSIKRLSVEKNSLENLLLRDLPFLQSLNASHNQIKSVEIYLPSLRSLSLSSNRIALVPFNFQNSKNLEFLDISFNKLRALPPFLCEFPYLEKANFSNNQITELDINWEPTKLTMLDLSDNCVSSLPEDLLSNTQINHLKLVNNKLSEKDLLASKGVEDYLYRRKARIDKGLHQNIVNNQDLLS